MAVLQRTAGLSHASKSVGAATPPRIKRRVWTNAGAPSGAAPDGMSGGDWIYDTTNDDVYWWISSTSYIQLNQIT